MREFMTQIAVIEEFIKYINGHENEKKDYEDELNEYCNDPLDIPTWKGKKFIECGKDLDKYLHLMASNDTIINLDFLFKYDTSPNPRAIMIFPIMDNFLKAFDGIYHNDIMKQVEVGKKLLIRYLKEQNIKVNKSEMVAALNERLNYMSMLTSTIPYYVITTVIDIHILGRGNLGINALNSIVKGFNKFYTDIMTQQE
mgnify:FL=1